MIIVNCFCRFSLFLVFIFFNLWSKVIANVTKIRNLIFNDKWNISGHAQADLREVKLQVIDSLQAVMKLMFVYLWRERRCFCKWVQILTSERQGDRFLHFDCNSFVLLVNWWSLSQFNVSRPCVTRSRETNAFLCACDNNRFPKLRQITTNASEFCWRQSNDTSVVCLWDPDEEVELKKTFLMNHQSDSYPKCSWSKFINFIS